MKAKVKRGSGFRGVLNYALSKDAGFIVGGNMSSTTARQLSAEFAASRRLRPDVERPVWHCSLSAAPGERLTDDQWASLADDFMKKMQFSDSHQYTVIKHLSAEEQEKSKGPKTQHVHIIASRISLSSELWLGQHEAKHAINATQQLEKSHLLVQTVGLESKKERRTATKNEIEKAIRTGEKPPRYVIQDAIDESLNKQGQTQILDFIDRLKSRGVEAKPNIASTGRLNGFSFTYDGLSFTGQKVGPSYTLKKLQERGLDYEQTRDSEKLADIYGKKDVSGDDRSSRDATFRELADDRSSRDSVAGELGEDRRVREEDSFDASAAKSDSREVDDSTERAVENQCSPGDENETVFDASTHVDHVVLHSVNSDSSADHRSLLEILVDALKRVMIEKSKTQVKSYSFMRSIFSHRRAMAIPKPK